MSFPSSILNMSIIPAEEAAIRCLLAIIFALVIGWDRDAKDKPIDFRAYMIIAVTTCIIAMMGQELYADYDNADAVVRVDLSKIVAGVLTGIGFLGAGAIIKRGDDVVGSATGASIWASGGIGLALGFGFYTLAAMAFIAITFCLIGGNWLMAKLQKAEEKAEDKMEDDK